MCIIVCLFSFGYCVVFSFELRILITPLASSKYSYNGKILNHDFGNLLSLCPTVNKYVRVWMQPVGCVFNIKLTKSNWTARANGFIPEQMVSSPGFDWVQVTHLFSFLCVVLFVLSVFVLCVQCCQCLWIVHSWLLLWFSMTFICIWVYDCSVILHVKSDTFLIFSVSVAEIQLHIEIEKVI